MPASWVKNEAMWKRAKGIVKENYPELKGAESGSGESKERFFALVTTLYKKLCASPKHKCEDFSDVATRIDAHLAVLEARRDAPDYRRASGKSRCGNCFFADPKQFCRRYDFTFDQGFTCDAWRPKDRTFFHTGYLAHAHRQNDKKNAANGNGNGNGNGGNGGAPPPPMNGE